MSSLNRLSVKGLPAGWKILQMARAVNNPRDAVVLCSRTVVDGDHGTEFVVWMANLVEGGCFHGHYTDDYESARKNFVQRKARLR